MIVLGSAAGRARGVPGIAFEPRDVDLLGAWEDVSDLRLAGAASVASGGRKIIFFANGRRPVEIELAWPGSTAAEFAALVESDPETKWVSLGLVPELLSCGNRFAVPSVHALFALKTSHRFVSGPHFEKTRQHWRALRDAGARVTLRYQPWLARREAETYARKPPRLAGMSRKAFFGQHAVPYVYDHDAIHRALAIGGVPAYTRFRKDGAEVEVSRAKFEALPLDVRIASVVEEAYVLAIERAYVPHKTSARRAFRMALEKMCCGITSGWWRDFAYEHIDDAWALYDWQFTKRFDEAVARGAIPRVDGGLS